VGWFKSKTYKQKLLEAQAALARLETMPNSYFDYEEDTTTTEMTNDRDDRIATQKAEVARLNILADGELNDLPK
jgi:hypothetical protein